METTKNKLEVKKSALELAQLQIDKIPIEIINMYMIHLEKDLTSFSINKPSYINIDVKEDLEVYESEHTWTIKNNKVSISIWKDRLIQHNVVF